MAKAAFYVTNQLSTFRIRCGFFAKMRVRVSIRRVGVLRGEVKWEKNWRPLCAQKLEEVSQRERKKIHTDGQTLVSLTKRRKDGQTNERRLSLARLTRPVWLPVSRETSAVAASWKLA